MRRYVGEEWAVHIEYAKIAKQSSWGGASKRKKKNL